MILPAIAGMTTSTNICMNTSIPAPADMITSIMTTVAPVDMSIITDIMRAAPAGTIMIIMTTAAGVAAAMTMAMPMLPGARSCSSAWV